MYLVLTHIHTHTRGRAQIQTHTHTNICNHIEKHTHTHSTNYNNSYPPQSSSRFCSTDGHHSLWPGRLSAWQKVRVRSEALDRSCMSAQNETLVSKKFTIKHHTYNNNTINILRFLPTWCFLPQSFESVTPSSNQSKIMSVLFLKNEWYCWWLIKISQLEV